MFHALHGGDLPQANSLGQVPDGRAVDRLARRRFHEKKMRFCRTNKPPRIEPGTTAHNMQWSGGSWHLACCEIGQRVTFGGRCPKTVPTSKEPT